MIKSMTGYGKAETAIDNSKYIVELRSVNGKAADISLKTSLIPREKEMELRQWLAGRLNRGTIDLFITVEKSAGSAASTIDAAVLRNYLEQISAALEGTCWADAAGSILTSAVRMPDVLQSAKEDLCGENWDKLFCAIKAAAESLDKFRIAEGAALERDVLSKVDTIESLIPEVEAREHERIATVRGRLDSRLAELRGQIDSNRLEQEIIIYVDKFDINEEKVRLRQHCKYFRQVAREEELPGKKLGFIAQEMGREINTLGSKANHAEIQKTVVKMKAELEKIKEQSLNIL